jgi:ubiquitin-activating enzyme E1
LEGVKGKDYKPKTIAVQTPEEEKENQNQQQAAAPEDEEKTVALLAELERISGSLNKQEISPAEFEKDDDSNFHIDFINAAANLRATNY